VSKRETLPIASKRKEMQRVEGNLPVASKSRKGGGNLNVMSQRKENTMEGETSPLHKKKRKDKEEGETLPVASKSGKKM